MQLELAFLATIANSDQNIVIRLNGNFMGNLDPTLKIDFIWCRIFASLGPNELTPPCNVHPKSFLDVYPLMFKSPYSYILYLSIIHARVIINPTIKWLSAKLLWLPCIGNGVTVGLILARWQCMTVCTTYILPRPWPSMWWIVAPSPAHWRCNRLAH